MLERLREAGRIAGEVRRAGAREVVAGARLRDVCQGIDDDIRRRGGALAFPTQSSRNHVAAHYCASPEDATRYASGDLAKLDIGVAIDGWVVDTALTVLVGDHPARRRMVEAVEAALAAAIAEVVPGVPVRRLSARIESTIRGYGLRPLHNLCGHGVGRWTVHCAPAIPNLEDSSQVQLAENAVVAIEPFATDGAGYVTEDGVPEVFRLDPAKDDGRRGDPVVEAIRDFRGLPFSRRQLGDFPRPALEASLRTLAEDGLLHGYAPLVEQTRRPVAQAEHTILVGPGGAEVLTR